MKHIVEFRPGHDCIKFECRWGQPGCAPGKGGSHGIHGLTLAFIVQGDAGAVQFILYTGWLPQIAKRSSIGCFDVREWIRGTSQPMPADLGYHSKAPRYDDQSPIEDSCPYCDGQPCYYDGSGLKASDAMYTLVNGGDAALWSFLEAYYEHVFNGGTYPQPSEYPTPKRGREQSNA